MAEFIVDLPVEYQSNLGKLEILHEEDALCWLWAFPELLPWPNEKQWLYTPVVGNDRWPGDLWGIDQCGELIIIECKQCRRSDDPFIDFLKYHDPDRIELTGKHWVDKHKKHLQSELAFQDGLIERPKTKTDGILPRSNKRAHIRRWSSIATKIDRQIRSMQYEADVINYLLAREQADNPEPYYIALMVISESSNQILTNHAIESGRKLQCIVPKGHVQVISIGAERISKTKATIISNIENIL